jgi:hypothetical protein
MKIICYTSGMIGFRLKISKDVTVDKFQDAKKAAINHPLGELPKFTFTEANPEWVLLYEHAQTGQLTSAVMRRMRRRDLYYLAGLTFPHPALIAPKSEEEEKIIALSGIAEKRWERLTKLQANAVRAKIELDRRNFIWTSTCVVLAALSGGFLGSDILSNLFS